MHRIRSIYCENRFELGSILLFWLNGPACGSLHPSSFILHVSFFAEGFYFVYIPQIPFAIKCLQQLDAMKICSMINSELFVHFPTSKLQSKLHRRSIRHATSQIGCLSKQFIVYALCAKRLKESLDSLFVWTHHANYLNTPATINRSTANQVNFI